MASALKNLSSYDEQKLPSITDKQFGIVVSDYHSEITYSLYEACYDTLIKHGADPDNIYTAQVPGTFELPAGAKILATSKKVDAVICLGCVIKGETPHNDYINQAVASSLANMSMMSSKPFIFGVLTPNDEQQAKDRAGGKHGNKGIEAAIAAIRMASLKDSLAESKQKIGF